ncbi:MAG: alpha/beta fold hydrolase [Acholeplasmatales bacterium]|nr:alpha/beta fold hydrolase [Acholeplasmatales bacterium]
MKAALLLHGFATSIYDYYSIMPFLKKRYDAIFLEDLPGHGKDRDLDNFTVENVLNFVNKRFDEIKAEYEFVDVYGYSMGGVLATYLGVKKEVNRVILLAPANKYVNARIFATKIRKDLSINSSGEEVRKEVIKENGKIGIEIVKNDLLPRYNVKTISTFISLVRVCNESLKQTNVKTLLVRGDMDEFVPEKSSKFIQKYFLNFREEVIQDMGHLMLKSRNYRLILNKIRDFLDE